MRRAPLWLALVGTLVGCGASVSTHHVSPAAEAPPSAEPPAAPVATAEPAEPAEPPAPPAEPLLDPIAERKTDPRAPKPPPSPAKSSTSGDSTGDSFGAGGLGLSGIGEGGGGKGGEIGLGSVGSIGHGAGSGSGAGFGSGHGRLGRRHRAKPPRIRSGSPRVGGAGGRGRAPQGAHVAAGEWDDNANYREFLAYVKTQGKLRFERADLRHRRFLVVQDAKGQPVPNCRLEVRDGAGHGASLTSTASGRAILFPHAEGLSLRGLNATASCGGAKVSAAIPATGDDAAVALKLPSTRDLGQTQVVDVVFVLDTTGSMSEEIAALQATLAEVSETLSKAGLHLRVGLVEYRDRSDVFTTRRHPMTTNAAGLAQRIRGLRASGGGDAPEDVNEGLRVAIENVQWSPSSVARLAFLIGDAPPQLDYGDGPTYLESAQRAAEQGIKLFTIAASGQDDQGQMVWRQIAQYTGATNMFVLRGGAGPQSTGGGDPTSSCGGTQQQYTSGNLASLIRGKVRAELASLDADPMRIAGLHQDEHAKPCAQRVAQLPQ